MSFVIFLGSTVTAAVEEEPEPTPDLVGSGGRGTPSVVNIFDYFKKPAGPPVLPGRAIAHLPVFVLKAAKPTIISNVTGLARIWIEGESRSVDVITDVAGQALIETRFTAWPIRASTEPPLAPFYDRVLFNARYIETTTRNHDLEQRVIELMAQVEWERLAGIERAEEMRRTVEEQLLLLLA